MKLEHLIKAARGASGARRRNSRGANDWRPSKFAVPCSGPEGGIALVITLIMLSIITFMAVTFLVLSQRERNSTTTETDTRISQNASETAMNRALAELLSRMMSTTNNQSIGLMVPTNYVNYRGFDAGPSTNNPYNVNYSYLTVAGAFTVPEWEQNIANLWLNPRPPVFVITNSGTGSNEFRYYLDLNRNGRDDT